MISIKVARARRTALVTSASWTVSLRGAPWPKVVAQGGVIRPTLIPSASFVGAPVLAAKGAGIIAPALISSSALVGSPTVESGPAMPVIVPIAIGGGSVVFAPAFAAAEAGQISPAMIAGTSFVGSPVISQGAGAISPATIGPTSIVLAPALAAAFAPTIVMAAPIAATSAVLAPSISADTAPKINALLTDAAFTQPLRTIAIPAPAYVAKPAGKQIIVDRTTLDARSWLGVGAAITDSTAYCMMQYMSAAQRAAMLQKVFVDDGFSLVRICMGDSDYSQAYVQSGSPFATYDDIDPATSTDLPNFSIAKDQVRIIPILLQILALNPNVKIFAAPWTPPAVLKTGSPASLKGGAIVPSATNFTFYATYFLKFLQAYQAAGVPVHYLTVQNEPNVNNITYPSCAWTASDMTTFIGGYLGPLLATNGFGSVKILAGDCSYGDGGDKAYKPLADATAKAYTAGAAYHGYTGTPTTMSTDMKNYPNAEVHFTEGSFSNGGQGDATTTKYMAARYNVDVPRNLGQSIIWWNLLLATNGQPGPGGNLSSPIIVKTDGSGTLSYWPEYFGLAHLGRYVQRGARRCASTQYDSTITDFPTDMQSSAWLNPDGSIACFVLNGSSAAQTVSVIDQAGGSVSTQLAMGVNDIVTVTMKTAATVNKATAPRIAAISGDSVTIALQDYAPANGGAAITGYNIYAGTASGSATLLASNVALPYIAASLPFGQLQYIQAAAVTSAGVGALSDEITAQPTANPVKPTRALALIANPPNGKNPYIYPVTANTDPTDGYVQVDVLVSIADISKTHTLFAKGNEQSDTSSNSSYRFYFANGVLGLIWFDASTTTRHVTTAVAPQVKNDTFIWVRVQLNVGAAAVGNTAVGSAVFSYSTDGVSWTAISTVTGLGSPGLKQIGVNQAVPIISGQLTTGAMKIGLVKVATSTGKLLFSPDFTALAVGLNGDATFTDSAGNKWTLGGTIV